MKTLFCAPRGVLLWGACFGLASVARAQVAPVQTAPVAAPQTVASGADVSIPVNTNESKIRLRLRNGAAYLDEETKKREGNRVSARLDAEPGLYLIRPLVPGKDERLAGAPLSIVVPGLRREAGVWLFNGSLWIPKAAPGAPGAPVFLDDLRRGGNAKLPVSDATPQLLRWNAVPLQLPAAASDVAGAAAGQGGLAVGYLVAARGEMEGADALGNFGKTRAIILQVDAAAEPLLAARQLQNAARQADAVVLKFDAQSPWVPQLWPLKMARRMAEETENFDLPIFADVSAGGLSDSQLLELYQNGATGFLSAPDASEPAWAQVWDANSNWLAGAVTLEDMGVLNTRSPRLETLLADLRAAGRIPLAGQLPTDKNPNGESNMILLDENTAEATLEGASRAAKAGQTVYLEGLPAPALYPKMGEITGTEVKALAAPRDEILTLDDPWVWGAIAGRELPVTQRVSVTLKKSLAAQTREQKGMSIETEPRATGRLLGDSTTGDANGWMVCPVGKGRIFWLPHPFATTPDLSDYYAAVAGAMQPALLQLDGDRANVRVALRSTAGQTALLALFNAGQTPAKISVQLRGDAAYVVDLINNQRVDSRIVGFETQFETTIAPGNYGWLALAKTREDLEREQQFKRLKGRLK